MEHRDRTFSLNSLIKKDMYSNTGLIKFHFTHRRSVNAFLELNSIFNEAPERFYAREKGTIDNMLIDIRNFDHESNVGLLRILEINSELDGIEQWRTISLHELEKLKMATAENISPYSISTLLFSYLTHDRFLHGSFFIHPSVNLDLFCQTSELKDFAYNILQDEYLHVEEEISVYDEEDAFERYYCLSPIHTNEFKSLIANSAGKVSPILHSMVTFMSADSDAVIIKVSND